MKAHNLIYVGHNETLVLVSHFPGLRELPLLIEISLTIAVLQGCCLSPDYPKGKVHVDISLSSKI